jgi:Ca2+-binding EF-hand superfamily protein
LSVPSPLDAELLALLERAFRTHAGTRPHLEAADVQRALRLRSEYLAKRVLAAFDRNGDGRIQPSEFVEGVRALVLGSDHDKLAFAFRLWDHDGDGKLDRDEIHRLIALALAESDIVERTSQPADYLAKLVLAEGDRDHDGHLSFAELEAVVRKHPDLLARLTRAEAIWIAPNEELLLLLDERAGRGAAPSSASANRTREP